LLHTFQQTADSNGTPATTSVGWRYDFNDNYDLFGYVRRGIENTDETFQVSLVRLSTVHILN
jgi:hypothetical protein